MPDEILCYRKVYSDADETSEYHKDYLESYKDVADPDTMYHHQAMKKHDWPQFWYCNVERNG